MLFLYSHVAKENLCIFICIIFKYRTYSIYSLHKKVCEEVVKKRHSQGWVMEVTNCLDDLIIRIRRARNERRAVSIAYHGNVVDLWSVCRYT